jgi:hypothetical protein
MDEQTRASEENVKQQQLTDTELAEMQKDAEALVEAKLQLDIAKLRALPLQRVLTAKQYETLLSIKEEELTPDDKNRLAWAKLRLPKLRYAGTGYTPAQKKKVKAKRKTAKLSRKANRKK